MIEGKMPHIAADYFAEGYNPQPRRSNSLQTKSVVTSTTYKQAVRMAGKFESTSDGDKQEQVETPLKSKSQVSAGRKDVKCASDGCDGQCAHKESI